MVLYHDDVYFFANEGASLKNVDHSVDQAGHNYEDKKEHSLGHFALAFWCFIFELKSSSSMKILGLPDEMCNKFNGILKIRFRNLQFRQLKKTDDLCWNYTI